ncbi:MAG TPA: twin-arginine translocase subunit TatC [Ktedonobacterales bacterium]|jgi:sec-independent protein translocase protein TatC|nr:twin-arginine translocase subunit TatC [Ktedonobacterales bacterium]HEX5570346.1 twin-arginine translocase subunit TatC [Ktedonobacterales bacterium]
MAATDARKVEPTEATTLGEPEGEEELGGVMTLVEHLEELRKRLLVAIIAIAVCSVVTYIFWDPIFGFLLSPLPDLSAGPAGAGIMEHGKLVISDPIGGFMISLKVSIAVGIALATPVVLYQIWGFLAPAMTRRERKYAAPFTLLGVGLFVIGLVVGFLVLRFPIDWLVSFGRDRFIPLITADSYFTFVTYFLLAFGAVFELPLVLTFLGVVGVINSRMLREKRMYILFGLWVLSCFITPGADPISPIIIGAALTGLFELSIILLRVIKK